MKLFRALPADPELLAQRAEKRFEASRTRALRAAKRSRDRIGALGWLLTVLLGLAVLGVAVWAVTDLRIALMMVAAAPAMVALGLLIAALVCSSAYRRGGR